MKLMERMVVMKVKVNDEVYDAEEQPVMVILTDQDKQNIQDMPDDYSKYCMYPEDAFESREDVLEWMNGGVDD
jgi:hypothetical protein